MQTVTHKYMAVRSRNGHRGQDRALFNTERLYNAPIRLREAATGSHRRTCSVNLQHAHPTHPRADDPAYNSYSGKLGESVLKRVDTGYAEFLCRAERGKPLTTTPYRLNSLEISEPAVDRPEVLADGRLGFIHVKGLPRFGYRMDGRWPTGVQPQIIRVTRTPRILSVCPVFQVQKEVSVTVTGHLIMDLSLKSLETSVDNRRKVLQVPGLLDTGHRKTVGRLRRKTRQQRDSALKAGLASFEHRAFRSESVNQRFHCTYGPFEGYLEALRPLRLVEQTGQDSFHSLRHRSTPQLEIEYMVIAIEDTQIRNMVRFAKDRPEQLGTKVSKKAVFNRSVPIGNGPETDTFSE